MPSVFDSPSPVPLSPPVQPRADVSPGRRAFGDATAIRKRIYDNVLKAAQTFEPVQNQRHTLALGDVQYVGPEDYSRADQKRAILTRGSLGRQLRGTWTLTDNETGEVVARKKSRLGQVPYLTDRGTFVSRGNEYTMAHQMRLRPGVFTRIKDNGELEAHVNVLPGKGLSHRVFLDPKTGVFKIKIAQANIPLLTVLKAMGVKDSTLRETWGNDLLAANMQKQDPKALNKLYAKLARDRDPDADETSKREAVAAALRSMELDPLVTRRTLGEDLTNVDERTLLATTAKLLRVSRGEEDPDDRDHLAYQTLFGPEDVFAERIRKARNTVRQYLWKATAKRNLNHVPAGALDDTFNAALMTSGLGMPLEEINPADLYDQQSRVTRMGEGGIPSMDSVTEDARAVQPSQFGFIDFLRTPESGKVGVDLRIARGAMKGDDGNFYSQVTDVKTGKPAWRSPQDLQTATVAFPGEMRRGSPMVAAFQGGMPTMVPRHEVNFEFPSMEDTFSPLGNMIPLKSMVKGQRAVMAARMLTQALPVAEPESPLVQSGMPGQTGRSFEDEYGDRMGALRADQPGRVVSVDNGRIVVQQSDGTQREHELYDNFPFNRKTFLHQTPTVQPGQVVQPGDLLARSNFTNAEGTTALGKNARVAYLPFGGLNFEDANVISESFARRMSSEHMYQHQQEITPQHKTGLKAFRGIFPSEYDRKVLENFNEDGTIKPGTEVKFGDPLILSVKERDRSRNAVHRGRRSSWQNDSVTWNHHSPGVVTDVAADDKGVSVVVKAQAPMEVGDKLSGRYGDKGVIAAVIPDEQMPTDRDGRPYEVLLNPLGIISRTNPAQIVEAALGKIAAKTGKPYKIPDFEDEEDMVEYALKELQKHGMTDIEDVVDAATGRKIPEVFTGNRWFMKLHHTSESKAQGRGLGSYTAEGTPARGGEEGSKRLGMLELNALVSHGATDVIRDASLVRGQASPEYWSQFMSGHKPPTPKVPFVYEKFVNQLRAAGINPVRDGSSVHIMAMTDKDVDELTGGREITNADTVDWKAGLRPKRGGLFDERLTGGHNGRRWSYIKLHEPLPNPVMEEPIRRLLGLTKNKFEAVIGGTEQLDGKSGPAAIRGALDRIDLNKEIERAREEIRSGKRTLRDQAVRRLGYLKSAQRLGLHPRDWMLSKAPVLPPAFRPVSTMGPKKLPMVADPNYLYKELFDANRNLRHMSDELGEDVGEERLAAYRALRGVTGLGDPIHPKNQERKVRGILKHVFGSSPKVGVVQRRLLGSAVDLVGRSVITPNPDLDMDHVSIPEDKAWEIYKPFIVRNLVRSGMPRLQAARQAKERSAAARKALVTEMGERPVLINRAPTLHRYGIMAAWPKLTRNNTLEVSPLVVGGFNADFDGDAMNYHVPSTDEAAREAIEKMLPSRNLFSAADFKVHYKPSQEYVGGLYEASARVDTKNRPRVFATRADAIRAYRQGDINIDREVEILEDEAGKERRAIQL